MKARLLVAGMLIALVLGAGFLWLNRSSGTPEGVALPDANRGTAAGKGSGGKGIEVPTALANHANPSDAPVRSEQPKPPPLPLEVVEPMLELNIAAATASSEARAEAAAGSVDELLSGKHAGKSWAQLELSYRSVCAALELQRGPGPIPKDKFLSAEAVAALGIEAAWLKEKLYSK
jgi:hypothetical protein